MTPVSLAPMALIAWGFMGLAVWILLGALIVVLIRATRTPPRELKSGAIHVLEERYARGEITREDFLEHRAVLGGSTPGPAGDDSQ